MPLFATQLPTNWSPNDVYVVSDQIILKPAVTIEFSRPMMTSYRDSLFVITSSATGEEHIALLRHWIRFHAFIFSESILVDYFELGCQAPPVSVSHEGEVTASGPPNRYPINYDDIAKKIFFPSQTVDLDVSYRELFRKYSLLTAERLNLLNLFIFINYNRGAHNQLYVLTDSSYLRIATLVTILENVIGHPPNCPKAVSCPDCNKQLSHRAGSEKAWRNQSIDNLIMAEQAKAQYKTIIEVAYDNVRHATVHAGLFPTASFRFRESGTEVYDTDRTVTEYPRDSTALLSLVVNTAKIARCLLLHQLFGLAFFPPLEPIISYTHDTRTANHPEQEA